MKLRTCIGAALLIAASCQARSSELAEFNATVADAYGFYRSAVFYLRTGNAMLAGFELEQMRERWVDVSKRFAGSPPDAFADDARFAAVLADVAARVAEAAAAAAQGDADAAGKTLAPIRAELAAMRARAGVRVFSDCVDEINQAMEALFVYRHTPPALDDANALNDVKAKAAVVRYLVHRCDREAPARVREQGEFRRLADGLTHGAGSLFQAVDRRDATAIVNILREMRSFDRILFLRFG